ncbi:DNA polymerase III subunit delta [Thiopseudomonas denitrificans]|uniref:DNA polymerase III subunit delta n=1 Tax=Thiopseudomonas denitrificans TaxID=1501432 RepID=A0A4R6TQY6_9GAMM|nr:DNA polymerase III subunit delta [Thiopseudomonas denitrificans]TDQ35379.1 DNA polymerase III delta subunit [Thiopseudomonas denitrificans]
MRLYPDKLGAQLRKDLLPIFLVSSDDPLLQRESCDAIRQACREQGFSERQVFHVERSFDWNSLREASASLSLFAEKRILELNMPGGKPGDSGAKVLLDYLERPAEDTLLLITVPRLDSSTLKTKWAKALMDSPVCGFVQIPVVTAEQLPAWLSQRLAKKGLSADAEVLQFISDRVEGNLLAAAQEIEKLVLLTDATHLDMETVQQSIADSARYDIFTLTDAMLAGDRVRSLRILNGLRSEGNEVPVILWALAREIRQLATLAAQVEQGQSVSQVTSRVWPATRKPLVQQALQRQRASHWNQLLQSAQIIDEQAKGQQTGDPWLGLQQILLKFQA